MASELRRIPFEEFTSKVEEIIERVLREKRAVVVEKDEGEAVVLKPARPRKYPGRKKTKEDYEAFLASAGGWKDVDVDKFLEDNYESRRKSKRPPVEL